MPTAPHTRIRIVQSRGNTRVKELRAALARPGPALIGLEGQHLVEEALHSGLKVQTIFVRSGEEALLDSLLERLRLTLEPELLSVPAEILRGAVTTDAPQALAALAVPPAFGLESLFAGRAPLLIVLAGLQDPGNVGTILRSAEAFGASGVLALPGTANIWNAKCLRASMGSAFRLPVVSASAAQALAAIEAHGVRSLAAVAPAHPRAQELAAVDLAVPVALWIGNEGAGLAAELIARCDGAITIPCPGPVESLNAAIATSVLLYEASRQRSRIASPARQQHPTPA